MDDSKSTNGGTDRDQKTAATSYRFFEGATSSDATTATAIAATGSAATPNPAYLTGQLLSRGGWRDHTDGNRISTTRGDRVDFVYGNYKRYIFGRLTDTALSNDAFSISNWESSGGHNHDSTSTPGEVESIEWTTTYGGTWTVKDVTGQCNKIERFHGRQQEKFNGATITSTIGEAAQPGDSAGLAIGAMAGVFAGYASAIAGIKIAANTNNPTPAAIGTSMVLVMPLLGLGIGALATKADKTVSSSTNPKITETTYADTITEKTTANSVSETTVVQTHISEVLRVKNLTSETDVTGTITERTGDFGKEVVFACDRSFVNTGTSTTNFNQRLLLSLGLVTVGVTFIAAEKHIYGNKKDGPYGPSAPGFNLKISLGAARTFSMGASATFFMGTKFTMQANFVTSVDTPGYDAKVTVGINFGAKTKSTMAGISESNAKIMRLKAVMKHIEFAGAALH